MPKSGLAFFLTSLILSTSAYGDTVIGDQVCKGVSYTLTNTGRPGLFGGTYYQVKDSDNRLADSFTHRSDEKALNRVHRRLCDKLHQEWLEDIWDIQ